MASWKYQAPNRLLQPNSLGLGTTWNELTVPCRKVCRLVKLAWPRRRDAVFSLSRSRCNQMPAPIWCLPLATCKPSMYVNRFLRFQTLAALFGPAAVIAARPVVVAPPPITIPPGPPPLTNDRLEGNVVRGNES